MRGVASAARSTRPCDLDDLNEAMKLATPVMSDTVTLRARGARELPRGRPVTANSGPISVGEVSGRPRQHSKAAPTLTKMMQGGCTMRFGPVAYTIYTAEGIETALSIAQSLPGMSAWSRLR